MPPPLRRRHDRGCGGPAGAGGQEPVDFRKGADGLAALVREALGEDPFSGTIFVQTGERRTEPAVTIAEEGLTRS